jgi:hypothetical protein
VSQLEIDPKVAKRYREVCADPSEKCRIFLGFDAWSKQRDVLRAVRKHPRVAVRSAHGVGKTAVAARVVLDFLTEGRSIVVTTAPTWHQVESLLWKEIASACRVAKVPVGGKLTNTRLEIAKDWVAYGLSTDQPERFQGEHSPRLLFVADEASGVDQAIYNAAQGYLTAKNSHVLLIGNPTKMSGEFFKAFQPGSEYHQEHISVFDSPAFTGEVVPPAVLDALPTREWEQLMLRRAQGDTLDPEYQVRVLGEFASLTGRPYFRGLDRFDPQVPTRCGRFVGDPRKGGAVSWREDDHGPSQLWEAPKRGVKYAVWADVAGSTIRDVWDARPGDARSDAYAAYVVSLASGAIVASYHDRLADEKTWAWELARLGRIYHDAEIAVEKVGGFGTATLLALRDDLRYGHLYHETDYDSEAPFDEAGTIGWTTSVTTRPLMLAELEAVLREDPSRLRDQGLLGEMRSFVWNDRGKAEADIGYHDDRVIAAAGAMRLYAMRARPVRAAKPAAKRTSSVSPIVARAPKTRGRS